MMHRYRAAFATFAVLLCLGIAGPDAAAQGGTAIRGKIIDAEGEPIAGAVIAVVGTRKGTLSRSDGTYRLAIEPGTYDVQISSVGHATVRTKIQVAANGTSASDFTLDDDIIGSEGVVVVGTRNGNRTVVNTPVPIDVISQAEIRQSGLTETPQLLQMLAPSFNFPRPAIQDATDHVRPATLRGLGPDQVLVLVNGKRRHTSAMLNVNSTVGRGTTGVDLDAIPANSIERIEILRDGAAAQYGSDAIAGVINIILKSDEGTSLSATAGQTKQGDGFTLTAQADQGLRLEETGYLHLSGEYRKRNGTNRAGIDTRQQYFDGDPRNNDPSLTNKVNFRFGDPKADDYALFLNAAYPLAGGTSIYGFGGLTLRNGESGGFYRRANDDRTVRALYPDGFLPLIASTVVDASFTVGGKGDLGEWLWDASAVYGMSSFRFDIKNSANVSYGIASPREFYAGKVNFNQITANLDLSRMVDLGLGAPMIFATGAEFRIDQYKQLAGEEKSYLNGGVPILDGPDSGMAASVGSQVFPGYRPSDEADASRNNVALYVDLEQNVTESLLIGIAARGEHYSDFGTTINGKIATRFEPVDGYSVRAAASTGFRAPAVVQSFFSSTTTDFIGGNPVEIKTFPVSSGPAKALGAQDLKPEKSLNISAGVGLEPVRNLLVTADYYFIEVRDRIVLSENFTGGQVDSLLAPFDVSAGRFFTNAIDTRTNGLDLIVRYALDLAESGRLVLTGAYNTTKTEVTHKTATPPQLVGFDETLFGHIEQTRIEKGQPKDNINIGLEYSIGPFALAAHQIRFGEFTEPYPYNPAGEPTKYDQTFAAKWVTDIDLSYKLFDKLRIAVGGSNIFDVYPDKYIVVPDDDYNGLILPYSVFSPFGFNGAYYYGRVSVDL